MLAENLLRCKGPPLNKGRPNLTPVKSVVSLLGALRACRYPKAARDRLSAVGPYVPEERLLWTRGPPLDTEGPTVIPVRPLPASVDPSGGHERAYYITCKASDSLQWASVCLQEPF